MRRFFPAFVVTLLVVLPALGGEDGLTGYWKFSIFQGTNQSSLWLIRLDSKDGKLSANAEPLRDGPPVKIEEVKQTGDALQIKFKATFTEGGKQQTVNFDYEGKLPKPGAKKILGSISAGSATFPALMEATAAKTPLAVEREVLQRTPSDPKAFVAILEVIEMAKENKLEPKDLQELVDGSIKAGELFGPRYELSNKLRVLKALASDKNYPTVTLETARNIVKQIDPKSPAASQLLTLTSVAQILRAAGHKDEAAAITLETARRIVKQIDPKSPAATQLQIVSGVAEILRAGNHKDEAAAIMLDAARRIVKQVDEKSPALTQMQTLTTVADILRASDKKDEAKALEVRIDNLEGQAHTEYEKDALNFKAEKFAGRKGTSKRAVLVELFTGAMCPPCVAADMSFDGLEKTYSDKEVVLLQYHLNVPRAEPMTNADSDARFEYYNENYRQKVKGTPSIMFNGKPDASGGGYREDAPEKYKEYCDVVNKLLETPDTVELAASAVRTGDKIDITAKFTSAEKPGEALRLRLALVEDWVRFKGSNALQYHHRVVRALPGGNKGFAVKKKESEHNATIDLEELRRKLNKYLDEDYGPEGPRPMRLRNLHVVAFVQNDDTTEILQAARRGGEGGEISRERISEPNHPRNVRMMMDSSTVTGVGLWRRKKSGQQRAWTRAVCTSRCS